MRISGILGSELERLGLYLDEEEDLIYLKRKGEVLAAFATWATTAKEIKRAAQAWLKVHEKAESALAAARSDAEGGAGGVAPP